MRASARGPFTRRADTKEVVTRKVVSKKLKNRMY